MRREKRPLKLLEIVFRSIVPFEDRENLLGDLEEMFDRISRRTGKLAASCWYVLQILKFTPAYVRNNIYWSFAMIRNYVKIALRNIQKNKAYSFINIFGLAIGMACCLLIVLFVQDELSFDRYHEKGDRIYRLVDSFDVAGELSRFFALSSAPFAPALQAEFPEVEDAVRLMLGRRRMVTYKDKKFYEEGLIFADASLFNIFTFPLVKGDPDSALQAPGTLVVSEKIAQKYFGNSDPVNKSLKINEQEFLITGIMTEIPGNSHFHADMFASMKTIEQIPSIQERYFKSWARHEFYTYLLLKDENAAVGLKEKLPEFIEKHAAQQIKGILGGTLHSDLQPLRSIHLHSQLQHEISPTGDIKYVTIFSVIALFILLIACVNFMNLATARAANRSNEVGLRKVVGASRSQLVKQFLGESVLFTLVSLFLGLIFVRLALSFFNALTDKQIAAQSLSHPVLLLCILVILIFVGFVSGAYPAFFMSRYQPAKVLKGQVKLGSGRSLLRKCLVIFQFTISIVLIISTIVVLFQLDFLKNRKLGFDKDHVVVVPIRKGTIRKNAESIKAELFQNPNILKATMTIGVPGGVVAGDAIKLISDEGEKTLTVRMIYTDHDYIKTMGMEILEGRDFEKTMSTDTESAFIINEAAVRNLQLQDPLNTRFEWDRKKGKVIGVVKDFQFQSLKEEINPLVIHIWPTNTYVFAIRIRPTNIPETLAFIESKWRELDPAHPFEYSFMDDTFDQLYKSEDRLSQVFSVFSLLAIMIASLGLLGLALFMVEQRTKEIGIRKILGASMGKIFVLLSKEFALLVLCANLFAWPTAFFLMRGWLQNFAYRVDIAAWIYVAAAVLAFMVALLTVSFQAVKAALSDPVKSLRYE
jgi:putative ABC transport system permease protein